MKNKIATLLIASALLMAACKGNPQGAMGANDKPDSTAFDKNTQDEGRPEATQPDTDKNVGPGNDKTHATDTEDKTKHR